MMTEFVFQLCRLLKYVSPRGGNRSTTTLSQSTNHVDRRDPATNRFRTHHAAWRPSAEAIHGPQGAASHVVPYRARREELFAWLVLSTVRAAADRVRVAQHRHALCTWRSDRRSPLPNRAGPAHTSDEARDPANPDSGYRVQPHRRKKVDAAAGPDRLHHQGV